MTDFTRFLDALEHYVDARIVLSKTNMDPHTKRMAEVADSAEQAADSTRAELIDELRELFK